MHRQRKQKLRPHHRQEEQCGRHCRPVPGGPGGRLPGLRRRLQHRGGLCGRHRRQLHHPGEKQLRHVRAGRPGVCRRRGRLRHRDHRLRHPDLCGRCYRLLRRHCRLGRHERREDHQQCLQPPQPGRGGRHQLSGEGPGHRLCPASEVGGPAPGLRPAEAQLRGRRRGGGGAAL